MLLGLPFATPSLSHSFTNPNSWTFLYDYITKIEMEKTGFKGGKVSFSEYKMRFSIDLPAILLHQWKLNYKKEKKRTTIPLSTCHKSFQPRRTSGLSNLSMGRWKTKRLSWSMFLCLTEHSSRISSTTKTILLMWTRMLLCIMMTMAWITTKPLLPTQLYHLQRPSASITKGNWIIKTSFCIYPFNIFWTLITSN